MGTTPGTPASTGSTAATSRSCATRAIPRLDLPSRAGPTHDITAARIHALPQRYCAASAGLPTLTDKGYVGAGIGIKVPVKGRDLAPDNETRNQLIVALRAPAERGNALLKQTWKALQHVTLDPSRITGITAAALVLLHLQRGTR